MRLPRQVCGGLWLNFKTTFSSLELGVHGITKCSFPCSMGQEDSRQVSPLLFWQVPPHPLAPGGLWWLHVCCCRWDLAHTSSEGKAPLARCANPLWQPTSPHTTPDGRAWQGQWLLCHRGYLCSLKSPMCTQEGPSPSFSAIKCFLFRNLHSLRAIFSPHNQALLKPFSHSRPSI